MTATARFDDLRPAHRRAFALGPVDDVLVASTLADVVPTLRAAEEAVEAGNWVGGWVTYEAAPALDQALTVRATPTTAFEELPLVWFAVSSGRAATTMTSAGEHRLDGWEPLTSPEHHHRSVEEIRRRIIRGDTYQVNHTFLLRSGFTGDAASLYHRLVRAQSCGYGALIDAGRWVVASASPELFFEWRNGLVTCRPMKGTARRGTDLGDDAAMQTWLRESEKNRAENVMIVDMVRNDLGRIARVGTVEVPALFTTEKYDTVWQLTSTVRARPIVGTRLADLFSALFPSASITGAPKVSTMRIISQLETHPRGVYCGAVGFGGPGPEGPQWAFNVGIRTVLVDRRRGEAFYGTGGGITFDSEPSDEYAEALLKAELLQRPDQELRLLETTRWDPQLGARHLDRHLERAAESAAYFDIPFDPAEVRAAISRAVKERSLPTRIRVVVERDGWVDVSVDDIDESPLPLRLVLDDRPVDATNPLLYHKTTLRSVYEQAAARHPHADDVALWNRDRQLTETTIGNLALRLDGGWVTPPVACGLLAGTERAARLASGELIERIVTLDDLVRVTAIARLNSVRGWQEATLDRL